jgi:hypothetical protein
VSPTTPAIPRSTSVHEVAKEDSSTPDFFNLTSEEQKPSYEKIINTSADVSTVAPATKSAEKSEVAALAAADATTPTPAAAAAATPAQAENSKDAETGYTKSIRHDSDGSRSREIPGLGTVTTSPVTGVGGGVSGNRSSSGHSGLSDEVLAEASTIASNLNSPVTEDNRAIGDANVPSASISYDTSISKSQGGIATLG